MAAPIVVDIAVSATIAANATAASPDPERLALERALLDACSSAAGDGGCVLAADASGACGDPAGIADPGGARACVEVTFAAGDARVRVDELAPASGVASREVVFRDDDPRLERYRAAGLIVAGLVAGTPAPVRAPSPVAPAETSPTDGRNVLVRLAGRIGWNDARPWVGAELGADLVVFSPVFVSLSGSHDETWARDDHGVAEERTSFGLGAGLTTPIVRDRMLLRLRVELAVEELRASVEATGREDAGARSLAGIEGGAELAFPVGPWIEIVAGARVASWGGDTTVRVEGQPAGILRSWANAAALGLNVRIP